MVTRRALAALPTIVFATVGLCSQARANPCDLKALPQEVQARLANDYPDWQPENFETMDKRHRQLWLKDHPNDCPGIAIGHFESKTELSYGVFLVPKADREEKGARIVVFSRAKPELPFAAHSVVEWADGNFSKNSELAISKVSPGTYGEWNVKIEFDGLLYEAMEEAASIYYWKDGRYRGLSISD